MSIAILTQVYDEMRRLAIAGSVVAGGDFRLQKLIAPLEQAGAKAPVFARVAEAVKKVVESNEQTSADALLELTTLVNAILYTQGETGAAGVLEEIETTNLGAPTAQASARVLKPLLEALTTTGSGRLELIRDAHERGAFRDLRLVRPALQALDDSYAEIADFVADQILPLYGKAILPELRAGLNLKGKGGDARRLCLLHSLDAVGTRPTLKEALDAGSKEVKIAAIECLGSEPEDLSYLLEQATAKSQEVRQAAYRALAAVEDDAALAALQKALTGKDLDLAARSLGKARNARLIRFVIAEVERELAAVARTKDRKEISQKLVRMHTLLGCLADRQEAQAEDFILQVFGQRGDIEKIKGDTMSGAELNAAVARLMGYGTTRVQAALAEKHADLGAEEIGVCFHAARQVLPPAKVYEAFAPYLSATVDEKKKQRDPAWLKREAIIAGLGGQHYWARREDGQPPFDPRWLDVAIALKNLSLVRQLARPGHAAANAFLSQAVASILEKSRSLDECHEIVAAMVAARHPDATDAFVAAFDKHGKKASYHAYWLARLIPDLPRTAVPRLEALIPSLSDKVADTLLGFIQQLRDKNVG